MTPAPLMIGIAGTSCSGKTTLALELVDLFGQERAAVVSLDRYFMDFSRATAEEIEHHNFDLPSALDSRRIEHDMTRIATGCSVLLPDYDFVSHSRLADTQLFNPPEVVVVEGLHALFWPALRNVYGLKIFVDCSAETTLRRRVQRDVQKRGRSRDEVLRQVEETVNVTAERCVIPCQRFADIIAPGELSPRQMRERLVPALAERLAAIDLSTGLSTVVNIPLLTSN